VEVEARTVQQPSGKEFADDTRIWNAMALQIGAARLEQVRQRLFACIRQAFTSPVRDRTSSQDCRFPHHVAAYAAMPRTAKISPK